MKISIKQSVLLENLNKVQNAVSTKSDKDILKNILFEIKDNQLTLTATNQEIYISTKVKVSSSEDGATTIPSKKLLPIVSALPEGELTIATDSSTQLTNIKVSKINYNIQGLPAEDFPKKDLEFEGRNFNLKASTLKRIIDSVGYAMAVDKTRPVLAGLLFSIKDKTFTVVATDGKRLSVVEKAIESEGEIDGDSIIPSKSVNELGKLIAINEDIKISLGEFSATFQIGQTLLSTNLIEGNYPDYEGALPKDFEYEVKVDRNSLASAIRRVALILENSASSVKLDIKSNGIDVKASLNSDVAKEEIKATNTTEKNIILALNPNYINQAVESQSKDELTIKYTSKDKPIGIFGDEGFLGIVMPMRS